MEKNGRFSSILDIFKNIFLMFLDFCIPPFEFNFFYCIKNTFVYRQTLIHLKQIYHKDRNDRFNVPIKGLCTTKTHGSES